LEHRPCRGELENPGVEDLRDLGKGRCESGVERPEDDPVRLSEAHVVLQLVEDAEGAHGSSSRNSRVRAGGAGRAGPPFASLMRAMTSARILVVDDEPNARGALRTILAEEGYAVCEAGDGVEALAHLRNVGADLVLADVRMPKMDGITLLKEARESGIDSAFVVMT